DFRAAALLVGDGVDGTDELADDAVERADEVADRAVERADELRDDDLTGRQLGKRGDLGDVVDSAVDITALDFDVRLVTRGGHKVQDRLGGSNDVAFGEHNRGRTGEQFVEFRAD